MAAFSIIKWHNSLQEKQVELTERYEGLPLYPKGAAGHAEAAVLFLL